MPFTTIPNELILEIAEVLPARDLSVLSRKNSTLSHLLTPPLRRAEQSDIGRCIILDRPASLRSILRPPNTILNIDYNIVVPGDHIHAWPLHYPAQHCSPALVATIIALGAPVDEPERDNIPNCVTTLQCAVLSGNLTTVTHVLNSGADINRTSDHNGCTPLALACVISDEPVAHLLIDRGARLGADVLVTAAYRCVLSVLERLLDMGVPVDIPYYSTNAQQSITALQRVCRLNSGGGIRAVEVLLRRGADVNSGKGGWLLPLYNCVRGGNLALARLLIDFGAERDAMYRGQTLAAVAAARGDTEMVELLESYGR
ncbi:hypothetical protein Q9L58_007418 [Maublancomyces gigas]|uniref:Protein fem-1 homolog B n=1 Tax=Discina gigas TaxID=1032678 RepID=A0ABR3GCR1_9PEZI